MKKVELLGDEMDVNKFKKGTLYKVLYSESINDFKSPKGYIIDYDNNFLTMQFKDGKTKSISLKNIISVSELGDEE